MNHLPSTTYGSARKESRITLIDDVPQHNLPAYLNRTKLEIPSFPRDFSYQKNTNFTPASDQTSDASSMWSHRTSQSSFDDLYDVTESESEEVPIKISASVRKHAARSREGSRYPSLVIPSPSKWPTIQKYQATCAIGLSPASSISLTPANLATYKAQLARSPIATSGPPSLDGDQTSEQSCPSTPDLESPRGSSDGGWDQPLQLDPSAFEILRQLQPDIEQDGLDLPEPIITVSFEEMQEMQEIVKDTPIRHDFALSTIEPPITENEEAVSALTVPSPGGFFSSLDSQAAQTWGRKTPEPTTSTAEEFYGVPWRPTENPEITEITELRDVDHTASYEKALTLASLEHSDRTNLWLHAQDIYLSRFCDDKKLVASVESQSSPATDAVSPSKKSVKFVDGLDEVLSKASNERFMNDATVIQDPVFHHALGHIVGASRKRDAFIHAQSRVEAVHVERRYMRTKYCKQLTSDYVISTPIRPAPVRPISSMLPTNSEDDTRKVLIQTAERERQALDQIKPSAWSLQAEKQLYGGKLLNSPAEEVIRMNSRAKVLDFGGQAAGEWAWQVALEYPDATVYTTPVPDDNESERTSNTQGPSNHNVIEITKAWALPFANETFDIISARTLQTFLHAARQAAPSPQSPTLPQAQLEEDEYDLVLTELHRVLKKGGYLEYTIYDASLLHPGPLGLALSVEFAFNLHTRGYDPCACRTFLPRLRKAGFDMVRRGWVVLPMADVQPRWTDAGKSSRASGTPPLMVYGASAAACRSETNFFAVEKTVDADGKVELYQPPLTGSTDAVKAMTGLIGARAWEQWMLKLRREMGTSEEEVVGRVASVLEEGGRMGSGFKTLVGWARK